MRITDEQKERAAFVNLPQFLMAHGFDLKKVGKEYVWKDHDSLHINRIHLIIGIHPHPVV